MDIENYQKMIVWQKAMDVVVITYSLCRKLPKTELYALQNQMKRAAVSIPSNIAEGQARNSDKEFIQFLAIAKGSRAELETQLILCTRLNYLAKSDITEVMSILEEISKMLSALIKNLSSKKKLKLSTKNLAD